MKARVQLLVAIGGLLLPRGAAAQAEPAPFRFGVLVVPVVSAEFDTTEVGVGAFAAWYPLPLVAAEVELALHPADLGPQPAFSSGRVETLFGVSIGPRIGRLRPFVKVRPGILRFWRSPEPIACIAVFPAPLQCTLASGRTVAAVDLGGGLEVSAARRTFVRVEAGDRMLSFPGPVRDADGRARDGGFFAHDVRFAFGGGFRF